MELSTTIGEDCPVTVEYEIDGNYIAQTLTDPAEEPEVIINTVLVAGFNIEEALSIITLGQLRVEIEEHLNSEGN